MSTRTTAQKSSRIESEPAGFDAAGLEPGERFVCGERSEPGGRAQRPAGDPLRAAVGGRELPAELVDDAVNRARVRAGVGELSGGGGLSDAVVDELLADGPHRAAAARSPSAAETMEPFMRMCQDREKLSGSRSPASSANC